MGNTKVESSRPTVAVAATAVNRILLAVGPIFMVPLFVRNLEAHQYGLWITILSITSYYGFLNLGLPPVIAAVTAKRPPSACSSAWRPRHAGCSPTDW